MTSADLARSSRNPAATVERPDELLAALMRERFGIAPRRRTT